MIYAKAKGQNTRTNAPIGINITIFSKVLPKKSTKNRNGLQNIIEIII